MLFKKVLVKGDFTFTRTKYLCDGCILGDLGCLKNNDETQIEKVVCLSMNIKLLKHSIKYVITRYAHKETIILQRN